MIRFHGTIGSKNEMLAQRHLMQAEGTLQDIKEITEQALQNKKAAGDFCTKCSHWPGGHMADIRCTSVVAENPTTLRPENFDTTVGQCDTAERLHIDVG
jgi:hypothetical protein